MSELPNIPKWIIRLGIAWSVLFLPLVWIDSRDDPIGNAIIGMAIGLMILWMILGGLIQWDIKDRIPVIRDNIMIKFTIFATIMALIEEAITTTMTNLAEPIWGVSPNEAYITASTNYVEVVLLHSVIVFIPMYLCWGYLLSKYDFHYLWVYLLFGITGTFAESLSFGLQNLINIGFWLNIYGLTVLLPAYSVFKGRTEEETGVRDMENNQDLVKPPRWMYPISIVLPLIFAIPVVIVVLLIRSIIGV